MGQKVNRRAHELAHVLVQRSIAKQKPDWAQTRNYWATRVETVRHAFAVAWSEENLPGDPLSQSPLPGIFD